MSSPTSPPQPVALPTFDYQPRTRLVFGVKSIEQIGTLARELDAHRVLIVTDAGLVKAGHAHRVKQLIEDCGLETCLFEGVKENPTTHDVEECVQVASSAGVNLLVGLGGGSAMDT